MHELVCVGCGPGDPELLTVKAVKAIQSAEVIACPTAKEGKPSIALSVVESLIGNPEIVNLVFPMVKDKDTLESTWEKNTQILADKVLEGKKVVYLTVGDPYLYSTWIYLHRELQEKFPQIKISVIPGIVSMFTFASKVGISLAEGAETMAVIPSCYDLSRVKETAKNCDTMIFLKDGRYFDQVIKLLKESGFSDDSIFAIGQDLGTTNEIVRKMRLGDVNESTLTTKYFSIMVVKRA
ncbi:precorrin-2 C(20)-methyltransferase [Candidatus Nitrosotenuis uzonensis]|uniref:Precorrin-2 C20-methyltransferase n=1 Tax=Candidatus Nitrosotenuis uzonensis TaxID=1407055 RepID=A0A812EXE1_9ARCH|nr:precorrin-2 C(20)-methyltransferase [Candidatus Nitrosotenuis uzonensis]CAE6488760.1 Precorrin-2 C20-methyltransferase [Candidatus Nitrosotenuis uzonensis]